MKINVDKKPFDIWFRYSAYGKQKFTTAHLKDLMTNVEVTGWAICAADDQFSKKIGRKLALKRLFESHFNGSENMEFRTGVWRALTDRGMKLN